MKWNGNKQSKTSSKKSFIALTICVLSTTHAFGQCSLTGPTVIPTGTYDVSSAPTYFPTGGTVGNLVINTGSTVTITNTTNIQTKFQTDAIFTVQAGATLYLNGVNFTSCTTSTVWNGIQVLGTQSASQTTGGISALNLTQQGLLVMTNYSNISNANIGVEVGNSSNNSYDGGIIRLTQVTFSDCYSAITFDPYSNPNWSYINECNFTWDKIINTSIESFAGMALVTLNQVHGVFFAGANTFSNTTPYSSMPFYWGYSHAINPATGMPYEQATDRGSGIFADNSGFYMKSDGPCWEKDNPSNCIFCTGNSNTFQYLSIGINTHPFHYESLASDSQGEVMISGCYFRDCEYGICLNYVPMIFINRNVFRLDDGMDTFFHYPVMQGITISNNSYLSGYGYFSPSSLSETMEISDNVFNYKTTMDPGGCNPDSCERKDATINAISVASTLQSGGQSEIYHNTFNMSYFGLVCKTWMNAIEVDQNNSELQINCNTFNLTDSGSVSCCGAYGVPHTVYCADIFIDLDSFADLQPQTPGGGDAGNLFSPNCGTGVTVCGLSPGGAYACIDHFLFNGAYGYGSANSYMGGTLYYYYDPATARKQPICNINATPLSVNTTATSNSCSESSYCQFFSTAAFSEDEYTEMNGVHDPTNPNDNIEESVEDWECSTGPSPEPSYNGNKEAFNGVNTAQSMDTVIAHYYPSLNAFSYDMKNSYSSGQLVISDMMGRIIKTCTIYGQSGAVSIQLPENNSYIYSIIIDGQRAKSGVFFIPAQ